MVDALLRLGTEGSGCCAFYDTITRDAERQQVMNENSLMDKPTVDEDEISENSSLNPSQMNAVKLSQWPLTLIWGPPGK